jgi:hypothetical protein
MDVSEAKRLKALEDENAKLKKLLAEQMLDAAAPSLTPCNGAEATGRCRKLLAFWWNPIATDAAVFVRLGTWDHSGLSAVWTDRGLHACRHNNRLRLFDRLGFDIGPPADKRLTIDG